MSLNNSKRKSFDQNETLKICHRYLIEAFDHREESLVDRRYSFDSSCVTFDEHFVIEEDMIQLLDLRSMVKD